MIITNNIAISIAMHCCVDIIAKMADCRSDVEFKNDKHCGYDENDWRLTNYDFFTSFWRNKAVVMSHCAARTLAEFLAKTRLLDRDVNFICR